MRIPNFIIGGASAAGTSYLYELLIQHPEIYLPQERIPEPHYYYKSWEYRKGFQWYLKKYFSNVTAEKIAIGERSSSYLYGGKSVASRIAKDFPKMKFIFMLRNPIQRAFANYRFTVLQGLETLSFEEALLNEKQRIQEAKQIWSEIQPYDYTGRGFYAKQLKEFLTFFPKEQILCLKSEDVSGKNFKILRKIYQFLELNDENFISKETSTYSSLSVVNVALQAKLRMYFGDKFSSLVNAIRGEENICEKEGQYKMLLENLQTIKEEIPLKCQEMLTAIYKDEILELQEMVDFDTSTWLSNEILEAKELSAGGGQMMS